MHSITQNCDKTTIRKALFTYPATECTVDGCYRLLVPRHDTDQDDVEHNPTRYRQFSITSNSISININISSRYYNHNNNNTKHLTAETPVTVSLTNPNPPVPTSRPQPPSPAGSYYAMSDDEEGDYNTITSTSTGRGVKLLYTKSKVCFLSCPIIFYHPHITSTPQYANLPNLQVYIHPTPSAKDNIPGYIALLQQRNQHNDRPSSRDFSSSTGSSSDGNPASSDLLLAWVPESQLGDSASLYVKVDLSTGNTDSPPKQSYLVPPPPTVTTHRGSVGPYAFAIPVSAIYSLLIRPPSVGWWWGSIIINSRAGDSFPALFFHDSECQSTILQKKKRTADTFDPFGDAGQMFWGGDEVLRWLKRYVAVERSGAEPNIYLVEPSREDSVAFGGKPTTTSKAGPEAGSSRGGPGGNGRGGEAQMDPFVKMIKEAGWNLMEKFSKVTTFTRQAANDVLDNPRVPPQMRRLLRNPEVQTLQDEFDSARIYLARWAMGIAEQSDRDRSRRTWTARDVMELEDTDVGEFELVDGAGSLSLEERRRVLTMKEWKGFFDERTGRLSVTVDEVKERIFHGGLDPEDGVRKEAWLFLLGVYDWYSTEDERKAQAASLRDAYIKLKGAWWERQVDLGGEGEEGEWWREQRNRIGKTPFSVNTSTPFLVSLHHGFLTSLYLQRRMFTEQTETSPSSPAKTSHTRTLTPPSPPPAPTSTWSS